MALTVAQLAAAIKVGTSAEETAQVERIRAFVLVEIERIAADAPDVVKDEATVRVAGYLYDAPTTAYVNAITNSGAAAILLPYRRIRAGKVAGSSSTSESTLGPSTDSATVQRILSALDGGRINQVLAKRSNTDLDTIWVDVTAEGIPETPLQPADELPSGGAANDVLVLATVEDQQAGTTRQVVWRGLFDDAQLKLLQTQAQRADTVSAQALREAGSAETEAAAANTKAEGAEVTATNAQERAETGITDAAEALRVANQGVTDAAEAKALAVNGGVPFGGTTGQVLTKSSNTNQDVEWAAGVDTTARGSAGRASATAGQAKTTADAAKTTADAAKTAADAAKTTADANASNITQLTRNAQVIATTAGNALAHSQSLEVISDWKKGEGAQTVHMHWRPTFAVPLNAALSVSVGGVAVNIMNKEAIAANSRIGLLISVAIGANSAATIDRTTNAIAGYVEVQITYSGNVTTAWMNVATPTKHTCLLYTSPSPRDS